MTSHDPCAAQDSESNPRVLEFHACSGQAGLIGRVLKNSSSSRLRQRRWVLNERWQAEHVAMPEVLTAPLKMRVRLKAKRVRE